MPKQSKIVDLEVCEDGSYSSKGTKAKAVVKSAHSKGHKTNGKHKYMISSGVDEFLSGIDVGLDLVENIKVRAIRMMGLRE